MITVCMFTSICIDKSLHSNDPAPHSAQNKSLRPSPTIFQFCPTHITSPPPPQIATAGQTRIL